MKALSKFNIAILFLSTCITLTACGSGGGGNNGGGNNGGGNNGGGNQPTPTPPISPTSLTPSTRIYIESPLYSFTGGNDGAKPQAGLIKDSDGNFYGTTYQGGKNGVGTVFKITPQGQETVLYSFAGGITDGAYPYAGLTLGSDNNFYGTTYAGGTANLGTVFKVTPQGVETPLYSFTGTDGAYPYAGLTLGSDNNFYGTTYYGGKGNCIDLTELFFGCGTVFKITPQGVESPLYSFAGGTIDGAYPNGLIQGSDGNFYGTTTFGVVVGVGVGNGTVFKITPQGKETVLYSFVGGFADGGLPTAGLIQGNDGSFYGTTSVFGAYFFGGTVFKMTPQGKETLLYSFAGGTDDGAVPSAPLIQDSDGNFYGTTEQGSNSKCADGCGTVFKITPQGQEIILYRFESGPDGANPTAGLIQDTDGNLYGTTQFGGSADGCGTVFKITPQ